MLWSGATAKVILFNLTTWPLLFEGRNGSLARNIIFCWHGGICGGRILAIVYCFLFIGDSGSSMPGGPVLPILFHDISVELR